jgi:thioredoxin reductase
MNNGKPLDYLVLGAGPAGLQLGYYLARAGASYAILEGADRPGDFFNKFPRHRKLISINKVYTGYDDPQLNMRWDWNSLLTEPGEEFLFKDYSREYFPPAEMQVEYLAGFAERFQLNVRCNSRVENISRADEMFCVRDANGHETHARVVVVATGCAKPYVPPIPGIELAENYNDMSVDADDFNGQRVLILGKGNSAFETADHLVGAASLLHLASPHSVKFAWKTHHVGHLRAVNNNILDTYLLKSQNALLDAEVSHIRREGDKLHVGFGYAHAGGEQDEIVYDRVLCCTGFRFDGSIFADSCMPELAVMDRFPAQTSQWESTNIENLYFAGSLMQMRDFKKKQSAFIHGFRYNVRTLGRLLLEKYQDMPLEFATVPKCADSLAMAVIDRINSNSGLWQQNGFLCDLLAANDDGSEFQYYTELPSDYVVDAWSATCDDYYTVTMEYRQDRFDEAVDVFAVERINKDDVDRAYDSAFLHPIVRHYRSGELVSTHHVIEDLRAEWREPKHIDPLTDYFRRELAATAPMAMAGTSSDRAVMGAGGGA